LGSFFGSQVESEASRRRGRTGEALFPSTASVSVVMVWMILGSIGAFMRTPNGKQCTGKEKQSEFFFSQAEQKRSVHN
jgi:hypothetical protein